MLNHLAIQSEYLLRILVAALCGAVIGYERESHMKMAGIRTHAIVSLTASLMMIISKYGFFDILYKSNIGLDPSRIAAGIVTAVGFLGAGVIFTRKMNVSGITTAAGIWATVGIGMACGAGMYLISFMTTLTLLILQFIFHRNFKWAKPTGIEQVTLRVTGPEDVRNILENTISSKKIGISNIQAKRINAQTIELKIYVKFPDHYNIYDIVTMLEENPNIHSIDI